MKGIYKTKEGSKVEVLDFDEANKIAMISNDGLQNRWVDEKEYSTWEKEGVELVEVETGGEAPPVYVEETEVEQVAEEAPVSIEEEKLAHDIEGDFEKQVESEEKPEKKKRATKKKDK